MKETEEQQSFELKSRLTREQEATTQFEAELEVNGCRRKGAWTGKACFD